MPARAKKDADKACPCSKRTTEREPDEKRLMMIRLNRIEGQIRGIRAMVEKDAYCPDILVQAAAASAALSSFSRTLLENHVRHCVASDLKAGRDEAVDELMNAIQKMMR